MLFYLVDMKIKLKNDPISHMLLPVRSPIFVLSKIKSWQQIFACIRFVVDGR